jgi:hypothetical protein
MDTVPCFRMMILAFTIVSLGIYLLETNQARGAERHSGSRVNEYPITIDRQPVTVRVDDIQDSMKAVASFPKQPSGTKPTRDQIKALAKEIGLLDETRTNPHLSFLDGDIAYWYEQGLNLDRLSLEFSARKAVLKAADRDGVIIDDQGKLSWAAGQIMAEVLRQRASQLQAK